MREKVGWGEGRSGREVAVDSAAHRVYAFHASWRKMKQNKICTLHESSRQVAHDLLAVPLPPFMISIVKGNKVITAVRPIHPSIHPSFIICLIIFLEDISVCCLFVYLSVYLYGLRMSLFYIYTKFQV